MSKRHFSSPEDYSDYTQEEEHSEDQSQEEMFSEPDFEPTSEGTSLFTRETKIGLAVILVLLIVLGGVLLKRSLRSDSPPEAKQTTADAKKTDSSQSPGQPQTSSPKPTVVEPRPGSYRHGAPSEAAPWVPSSGGTSSKESGDRIGRGLWPSERTPPAPTFPSSGPLTPVRPSEPVGNAWAPGQAGLSDLPTNPRNPSRSSQPAELGPDSGNPLRPLSPSEPSSPGAFSRGTGLNASPNTSGSMPSSDSPRWGGFNPTREGQSQETRPAQPGTPGPGSFSSPYTPPASSSGLPSSVYPQGSSSVGPTSSRPGEFSSAAGSPGGLRPLNPAPQPAAPTASSANPPQPTPAGVSPGMAVASGGNSSPSLFSNAEGNRVGSPWGGTQGGISTPSSTGSSASGGPTPVSASSVPRSYVVQAGDSFWTIAEKLYGNGAYYQALAEYNRSRIPRPEQLRVGDQILVPSREQLEQAYPHLCPRPTGGNNPFLSGSSVRPAQEASAGPSAGRVYIVQEGDSLYEIARYLLGKPARWVEIYELNKEVLGEDIEHLRPGTRLLIPPAEPAGLPGQMSTVPFRPLPR